MKKRKYIATFEVEFDPDDMCDKKTLHERFGGSWDKCIEYLFEQDGEGIFDKDFKLIRVIK